MMVYLKTKKVVTIFIYLWVWLSTSTLINVEAATYNFSLKQGDTLNATYELYSKNRKFYLCFSSSDEDNHVVLSVKNEHGDVVWSFDRNQPHLDLENSAVLSLNHSGVLKIESQNAKPIILYSPPQPTNNIVATLLDTGNFVLQQLHQDGTTNNAVLWQSFDDPFDTLIPGMKLGVNRKTGHNWKLVSCLTNNSCNSGAFSLEWEPKTHELIIKQRNKVYWKSGQLRNSGTIFENIPKDVQRVYQYVIVSNIDEDSFTFKIKNDENTKKSPAWRLSSIGRLTSDYGEIAKADECYGFSNTGDKRCQRWEDIPTCRKAGDVFQQVFESPKYERRILFYNTSYGYSDCKSFCWSNCSCTGFKKHYINGTGCELFLGNSTGDEDHRQETHFYTLVIKPVENLAHRPSVKKWPLLSAMIAAALLIICPLILYLAFKKRKSVLTATSYESSDVRQLEDDLKDHDIKVLNYASVLAATTCFSEGNKLGQGGYGPVYKGILPTGQEVAVKRLAKTSGQGIVEFKNELTLICELQHTNLVQLLGCCIHEEEKILIYEYMPNKSLDFYLFDCTRRRFLNWEKRFNIIEGIAQGLLYLHKYSRLKIIHRDLKTSNILLDENLSPKISDFGMARMFTQQESTINTNRIVGTYGYMSPEYAMEGTCSTKSDVYSFGVLLLEIVSGRRNNSFYEDDRPLNLIGYAWELWKEGGCLQLMDPSLSDTFIPDEVQRCIHVGLLCVEHYADDRPNMSDVISMLTNKNTLVTLPKRPAFYVEREINQGTTTFKLSETCSSKDISTFSTFSDVE